MCIELDELKLEHYGKSSFSNLLHKYFSHVKFPKFTRLGKCDDCLRFKHLLQHSQNQEYEQHKLERDAHINRANEERLAYHKRRLESMNHPDRVMSIILDASTTLYFPHHVPFPRSYVLPIFYLLL